MDVWGEGLISSICRFGMALGQLESQLLLYSVNFEDTCICG